MDDSYHLPNELPRGLLSTGSDDKPKGTEKATQMQSVLLQGLIQKVPYIQTSSVPRAHS